MRDTLKEKSVKFNEKVQSIQQQKALPKNQMNDVQRELDARIDRSLKEQKIVDDEFLLQNKVCWDLMTKLVDGKCRMINPIITKLLQINSIFFSKAFSHF